ncbi:MAG: glycine cleavage system protein R, partial [Candidatus Sumerlaeaceae bacterium]
MMRRLLTFTGVDRPGLIAAIARMLANLGADIEDVSMSRLSGNFALMLLARGGSPDELERETQKLGRELGLRCHIDEAVEESDSPEPNIFVSAVGPNRVGIVAAIAEVLARHGVNIVEMATQLIEKTEIPIYLVRLEGCADCDLVALEQDLVAAGKSV